MTSLIRTLFVGRQGSAFPFHISSASLEELNFFFSISQVARKLPLHDNHGEARYVLSNNRERLICSLTLSVEDITHIIRSISQGSSKEQQDVINHYYAPSASLSHPLCRVPSFQGVRVPMISDVDSRMLVLAVHRW